MKSANSPNDTELRTSSTANLLRLSAGSHIDNIRPTRNKQPYTVADSSARDVELAVAAAAGGVRGTWSRPALKRSRILLRIADLIERDLEKLARAESIDTGKPLSLARSLDIPRHATEYPLLRDRNSSQDS